MSEDATSLKIIAQPNPFHRERYGSETCHGGQRSYRFIRSTSTSQDFEYPTIEIPSTWIGRPVYICVTLVTIVTPEQPERCVHPYPLDTAERDAIKDSLRNALYFRVTANDFERRVKSFRISMVKLVQADLRKKIPLRLFNSEKYDSRPISDARQCIDAYHLDKSQLAFSVAERVEIMETDETPLSREIAENRTDETKEKHRQIIYAATTAFSEIFSARKPTQQTSERHAQCAPRYGNFQGDEPVFLYVPDLDRRKICRLSFFYPEMNLMKDVPTKYIDTKTISFRTPQYPSELFPSEPVPVEIIVHQNDRDIARVNFLFRPSKYSMRCPSFFIKPIRVCIVLLKNRLKKIRSRRSLFLEYNPEDEIF